MPGLYCDSALPLTDSEVLSYSSRGFHKGFTATTVHYDDLASQEGGLSRIRLNHKGQWNYELMCMIMDGYWLIGGSDLAVAQLNVEF